MEWAAPGSRALLPVDGQAAVPLMARLMRRGIALRAACPSAAWPSSWPMSGPSDSTGALMAVLPLSSADPVADRRADFAEGLAARGDISAAIDVLSGALERVPGWAAGWYRLGEYHEQAGRLAEAREAWDRALVLDPSDPFGAGLKLELGAGGPGAESMPPAFVELLFDQYAPQFESSLLDRLEYRAPATLMEALERHGFAAAGRALDLGCGTGLMGEVLRPRCGWLAGYDISSGMLAAAAAKGLYDVLEKRDIARMELGPERFELIVAADVFAYIGALEQLIGWCAVSLSPGGWLAFTTEAGEAPVALRESRRFAHSRAYLEDLLAEAGFAGVAVEACVVRKDRGEDVASWCVTASAPPARPLTSSGDALEAMA